MNSELTELLSYLQSTDQSLLAELDGLNLNRAPASGGWSAGQIVAHLTKTEKYLYLLFRFGPLLGAVPGLLETLDRLNTALCKFAGQRFISNGEARPPQMGSLNTDFKGRFTAPAFLKPRKKQYQSEALLAARQAVRERTLRAVEKADFAKLKRLRFSHPLLGTYTLLEFLQFIGKHEEWHTAQIKRLK